MTAAVQTASDNERIIGFSPETVHAPFLLRCTALFIDYMVLLVLPVTWLIVGKYVNDTGTPAVGTVPWVIGATVFLIDFLVLPLLFGKTIGKLLTGMTIVNSDGSDLSIGHILRRNIFGYTVTCLTLGLGFVSAAFSTKGRALHDIIGGTVVVQVWMKTLVK